MGDLRKWLLLFLLALPLAAQTIYSGGLSFAPGADQKLAGTVLAAKPANEAGTYLFTMLDAVPTSFRPVSVNTNIGVGIGQRVAQFDLFGRKVSIFVPTAAGVSWTGKNIGWQWNGGVLADVPLKGAWGIEPNLRFLKSSVNANSDYQIIGGLLFRYKAAK